MRDIIEALKKFRDERDWQKYHTPRELARALSIESSELNELFLWGREPSPQEAAPEIADNIIYALNLCAAMGLDPYEIVLDKIKLNTEKYPVRDR